MIFILFYLDTINENVRPWKRLDLWLKNIYMHDTIVLSSAGQKAVVDAQTRTFSFNILKNYCKGRNYEVSEKHFFNTQLLAFPPNDYRR